MNATATPAVCLDSFEAGSIDPDVFDHDNDDICDAAATLRRYYSSELLASRRAREYFLLPNRLAS